jgi:hypothetical protein
MIAIICIPRGTVEVRCMRGYVVAMGGQGPNEQRFDSGIRLVLEELRDLRVEMRADRERADADRRRADADRRRADEDHRRERRQADERFEKVMRETQRAWRGLRSVGLSIVKTLNHHTRILVRIERRLAAPGRWRSGQGNGRGGGPQR